MKAFLKTCMCAIALLASVSAWATLPYTPIQFPRDDFAHWENVPYPVQNMTEWWYFIGKIKTKEGRNFAFYVSYNYFFTNWFSGKPVMVPKMFMQITDVDNKKVYGNSVFGDMTQSNFSATDMNVKIANYPQQLNNTLVKFGNTFIIDDTMIAKTGEKLHLALQITPTRAPMLVGGIGYVPEDNNTTSFYYSETNLLTQGTLEVNNHQYTIDPDQSIGWYDRQWGDFLAAPTGMWFWTAIQLDNKISINLRMIVDAKTKLPKPEECDATILMPNGYQIFTKDIKVENYLPHGNDYPEYYKITIPELGMHLILHDRVGHQNEGGLYEGIVDAYGTYGKNIPVQGMAWAESTIKN